jgi:hypothetical protein
MALMVAANAAAEPFVIQADASHLSAVLGGLDQRYFGALSKRSVG